jgi:hypothetical protein
VYTVSWLSSAINFVCYRMREYQNKELMWIFVPESCSNRGCCTLNLSWIGRISEGGGMDRTRRVPGEIVTRRLFVDCGLGINEVVTCGSNLGRIGKCAVISFCERTCMVW